MKKPCLLEMSLSGAWKQLASFDAADEERADDLMNAAADFADVVNDGAKKPRIALRITTADGDVLMQHESRETGWRDVRTGEPA